MEDFMTQSDELASVDKSISDVQDGCSCILPNSPDRKASPVHHQYIKQPCDHASKYHFTPDDPSSSSSSEDPACPTFTKKAKNTIISVEDQALCSKSCTAVYDYKKVKITVKGDVKLKHGHWQNV